jgi:hypothetical protein
MPSHRSIVVPSGHMNPQKNRPNTKVPMITISDTRLAYMRVRDAMVVMIKIRGSKRKNRYQ